MSKTPKKQHGGRREGAGRKPTHAEGKTIVVSGTVPEGLIEQLERWALKRRMNRSQAFTEAIRRLVRR